MTYFKVAGSEDHGWHAWECTQEEAEEAAQMLYVAFSASGWPAPPAATLFCSDAMDVPGALELGRVTRVGGLRLDADGCLHFVGGCG